MISTRFLAVEEILGGCPTPMGCRNAREHPRLRKVFLRCLEGTQGLEAESPPEP